MDRSRKTKSTRYAGGARRLTSTDALRWIVCAACAPTHGANNPAGAAALAVEAVAVAGINRAITRDCYAYVCAYGTQCDHDSGLCVPLQEKVDTHAFKSIDRDPEMCAVPDASLLLRVPCDASAD